MKYRQQQANVVTPRQSNVIHPFSPQSKEKTYTKCYPFFYFLSSRPFSQEEAITITHTHSTRDTETNKRIKPDTEQGPGHASKLTHRDKHKRIQRQTYTYTSGQSINHDRDKHFKPSRSECIYLISTSTKSSSNSMPKGPSKPAGILISSPEGTPLPTRTL